MPVNVVKSSFEFLDVNTNGNSENASKHIEKSGRTCYQSLEQINDESHLKFIKIEIFWIGTKIGDIVDLISILNGLSVC